MLVVRVEGVGLVQVMLVAGARGRRADHGTGGHDVGGDGQRLVELLRQVTGLGADGHCE